MRINPPQGQRGQPVRRQAARPAAVTSAVVTGKLGKAVRLTGTYVRAKADGEDESGVIGLPLPTVRRLLAASRAQGA